jgi:enediyne biosynthesis protein E4
MRESSKARLEALSRRQFAKTFGLGMLSGAGLAAAPYASLCANRAAAASAQNAAAPLFEQIPPEASGITWRHRNGRSAEMYLPETTGAGCGFIDYDNDGWMDIYLVNSGKCDFLNPQPPLRNALYHNNRDGTFTEVTAKAGVGAGGYGMGVAVGDFDGDGFSDLFVTQYGSNILYHNNGDGTFTDVTAKAGLGAPGWGTSAVWFDYDNDGRLDLFVCEFVVFDKSKNKFCGNARTGERYYCIPSVYEPRPSLLYHNNGDGTFTETGRLSDIGKSKGKAWGVVATDINNDGLMDLFVANDTVANFLFANRGHGKFEEIALAAGVGYSADGRARSGMGVDSADYDQDGWADLFVSNIDREIYSLYHNNHDETFDDMAMPDGIGRATRLLSGWGVKFFDYDNDGDLDLFLANGHPDDRIEERFTDVKYKEPMLLFHHSGNGFENVSGAAGPAFAQSYAARGLAIGDFDNDGAVDVLVAINNGVPMLLRNNATHGNHWLGLKLVGRQANRDAVGARISWQAGNLKRHRLKVGGGSYLAAHDPREVLGIGAHTKFDWIEIEWPQPGGKRERLTNLPLDRYISVIEGQGSY